MAVHIDRLVPTKSQFNKTRFKNSGLIEVISVESTHSLFFSDCRGKRERERGMWLSFKQINLRWEVCPLLKGVRFRIDCYHPSHQSWLGGGVDLGPPVARKQQISPCFTQMGPEHHQVSEQLKPRDNQEKTESVDTVLSIALTPFHAITILVEVWNRANYKESLHHVIVDEPRGKRIQWNNKHTEQKNLETESRSQQMSVREGGN